MLHNIPHQIAQSPARLGLPNPNSPSPQNPKFPSQTSQSQTSQSQTSQSQNPPNQPSNQLTTPVVSSTLLPLLPPLPRAQTLLQQMASLATKLFQVSPNHTNWISSYRGSLPTFLTSQTTPSPTSPSESSTKEVLAEFTKLQGQLFEAVEELQQILDLQDATEKLFREIRSKDSVLLTFANKLKETEHVLDNLVDDYSDYCRLKRTKVLDESTTTTTLATQLKLSDILSYAHKISYTTFAPPEFGAGGPLKGALPPAPQEEQMRASQLYNFADLDVGLPKTDEGKEKIIEPIIETPTEASPFANFPGISGLVPPLGWKPGMDVVLPDEVMIPPVGWRPGMEVVLPPLGDSLPRVEEPRPAPRAIGRAPEPIQVRRVDLDIPDGSSSDYTSSEDDSSDNED